MIGMGDSCFACGSKNPIGLKLNFNTKNEKTIASLNLGKNYEGYKGIVHGGILSTIIDSVMLKCLFSDGFNALTARMDIRFKKPVFIDSEYTASSVVLSTNNEFVYLKATIKDKDEKICVLGNGVFRLIV